MLAILSCLGLTNCGYNAIQTNDEQVKANWSEVVNQYQRRADLVPNLVNSVKGFAQQEKDVLLGVTNARAKVGSIQATPELINNPEAFKKFTEAQGELSSALSRLLVTVERYPDLKSSQNVRDLQEELSSTENKIAFARQFYNDTATNYNTKQQQFPTNLVAGLAKAEIAASQAELLVKKADAYALGETRKREAEAAVLEAQNRAMAKAALAEAERVEAEQRAKLEAPAKAQKAKVIVDAEASFPAEHEEAARGEGEDGEGQQARAGRRPLLAHLPHGVSSLSVCVAVRCAGDRPRQSRGAR